MRYYKSIWHRIEMFFCDLLPEKFWYWWAFIGKHKTVTVLSTIAIFLGIFCYDIGKEVISTLLIDYIKN
ncbi:hypothetical protein SAMN05660830_00846 [Halodesulfovibrio aestuarii]|uniref:Uncharacterized protein n=1 Tax=Halodesulfovibrio aestuarii TaxID=126333 RepID=A0A8G2C822_9BACT|nr:hypothetical protein SAMN05660830_00846 [Halodesulfovibrio aestuarii]